MAAPLEILSLQPFYGGSHRQFDEGWRRHSRHRWSVLSLPDRHWKWRMRHAPIEFAKQISNLPNARRRFDIVVCTDMLDLAAMKGLRPDLPPTIAYFHENQFAYPNRFAKEPDFHFPFTNFTSALAADEVWFNSEFNRSSMLEAITATLKRFPDYRPTDSIETIRQKSIIQPPGIDVDFAGAPGRPVRPAAGRPIKIVWAARWEHDKGPTQLLQILSALKKLPVKFSISIIGQQYRKHPVSFDEIWNQFADQIDHWGFVSRSIYHQVFAEADVFLSTANHEFFGLSFVEAVCQGCFPVVPDGLAYPELTHGVPDADLVRFETPDHAAALIQSVWLAPKKYHSIAQSLKLHFRNTYCWTARATAMDDRLEAFRSNLQRD